ncbi:podocalyxin [Orycteropus afer afer]|uniref:Podocalyxin n=1 Tax=Orycteropus afer afer TaxID=1230840 RepID=A0AC54ZDM3_ORYAF|nr:podocalyxin [Orycteropus afer afer]
MDGTGHDTITPLHSSTIITTIVIVNVIMTLILIIIISILGMVENAARTILQKLPDENSRVSRSQTRARPLGNPSSGPSPSGLHTVPCCISISQEEKATLGEVLLLAPTVPRPPRCAELRGTGTVAGLLSAFAVLERLRPGYLQGQCCVALDSRRSRRLGAPKEVPEAGDKPPATAHAASVLTRSPSGFPEQRPEGRLKQVDAGLQPRLSLSAPDTISDPQVDPDPGQENSDTTGGDGKVDPDPGQENSDTKNGDAKVTLTPDNSPAIAHGTKESEDSDGPKQSGPPTPAKSETTSNKSTDEPKDKGSQSVTTASMTPNKGVEVASPSPSQASPSKTTPAHTSLASTPSTPQSSGSLATQKPSGGIPEEQSTVASVLSSGPRSSPTVTSQETSATSTSSVTMEENAPAPGEGLNLTGTTASSTQQPAGPSTGPTVMPPVRGSTSSSLKSTATTPQGSHPSSSTWTLGSNRVKCEAPERPDGRMLVLNLTKASLCVKSPPDEKLVTVLCKTVKTHFNPARDQCHVHLAPVPDGQAVVLKEISVHTNLLPSDIYELLKDKWDDLKEVGVSNMQLGDQGPPEEAEDRFSMPLIITIVCMASFLLLVAALYGCCHQRLSHRKDQQRLTEELQTVENGYHDNPTLEVMETSSEMQEKKVVNLNGELGDSWIVPLDNLTKDDLDEEEDTHL